MKANAILPPQEAEQLVNLRESGDQAALYTFVLALRNQKWPLRAIADVAGVSRMGVKLWEDKAKRLGLEEAANGADVASLPVMAVGSGARAKKRLIDVHPDDRDRLKELAVLARQVRASTPEDAPSRKASRELDELLVKYIVRRGVQPMVVARHAGVTRRAIVARLERYNERQETADAA